MRVTVLGASGAFPESSEACSGFLVEVEDYRLVLDLGYGTFPNLLRLIPADRVDAVLVSHGHPDHCADLNPFLRARWLRDNPPDAVPIHAPTGALAAVLALDRPGMLDAAYSLHEFVPGDGFSMGPIAVSTRRLPHSAPNAGLRLSAKGQVMAYTGDSGPCPDVVELAQGADLFICEATYVDSVPADSSGTLSSARDAGEQAAEAGVARLLLTHLMPGTDAEASKRTAATAYGGVTDVARAGMVMDLP